MNALTNLTEQTIRWRTAEVTPQDAERWLQTMKWPRTLRPWLVEAFARDMTADNWRLNGVPLIFDRDGRLMDGQARLKACHVASRPFPSLIVEGVAPEDIATIDAIHRRRPQTILRLYRPQDSHRALASAVTILWQYYADVRDAALEPRHRPTAAEMIRVLEARPEIRDQHEQACHIHTILSIGVTTALLHLGGRVDRVATLNFLARLDPDTAVAPGDPAVVLRTTVAQLPKGCAKQPLGMLRLAIRTLNAALGNKPLAGLSWNDHRPTKLTGLPASDGQDLTCPTSAAAGVPAPQRPRPQTALTVSMEIVTPATAARLLANNARNRRLDLPSVERYRSDMAADRWRLNGQTLKLSRQGRLIDGQHRCRAAVLAGRSFMTLVVSDLDEAAFHSLDTGNHRGFAEVLKALGERGKASNLAAATRVLWQLENGPDFGQVPSSAELLAYLGTAQSLRSSLWAGRNRFKGLRASSSVALHFIFSQQNADKADEFFARLRDGANLEPHSPILVLRNRLIEMMAPSAPVRVTEAEKMALTIKAWNVFRSGREIRHLMWTKSGPRAERFPDIRWRDAVRPK